MATPLPIDQRWYRQVLLVAALVGLLVGALGLVYLGVTGVAFTGIFGEPRTEAWSGEWWWIGVTAAGGLLVAGLRMWWKTPEKVPGGVAIIEAGKVDHRMAPSWVALALVSAVAGASLGPSFALVMMGGGLAAWVGSRRWVGNEDARLYSTLAGIAGGFGGAFTSPMLGSLVVSELAPVSKTKYVEALLPQLVGAVVAFGLFFGVAGSTLLNSFAIPTQEFTPWQLVMGVGLGVASSVIMIVFIAIVKIVTVAGAKLRNALVRGVVGGALVGLLAVALPLTIGSGNDQLSTVLDSAPGIGAGLLLLVLVGKMFAMALSLQAGFIGGNVLPMLFVGGTAGAIAHILIPDIPYAIAVAAMLAAVPGSVIKAPIGLTLIAALSVGLGPVTAAPVAIAVVTAYLLTAGFAALPRARRMKTEPVHA